ncbi:Lipin/Ned1/Smp2-domain-containing protein [Irpex rosettiformis]|uniref:Lipin/Ned1/Smp2-domain-containing protein n=1 Tax=Irpex rosettiformis TaxID=378272 RepID=A0ACB8UE22_9APHY|nr:Lipin/Ned1/Smp2-domain-containing protein [Irpex rosettiformis]
MNYLRGAVSAISAPYQYYKDINPSTLTGAIDVIVIRRPKLADSDNADSQPAPGGETELACSPFHVRFGKWQVLRPADKKVDVFVNGNLIPFSMKIGEAGEAFFVFETDEDIPEDIVTSPLLEPTKPGEANAGEQPTDRFGAKIKQGSSRAETTYPTSNLQEPEFLDLNAPEQALPSTTTPHKLDETPPNSSSIDHPFKERREDISPSSILSRTAEIGKAALGLAHEAEKGGKDKLKDNSVKDTSEEIHEEKRSFVQDGLEAARNFSPSRFIGEERGDEFLPKIPDEDATPDVHYGHDMVFDTEGYHSHKHSKDHSADTVTQSIQSLSPVSSEGNQTPGPSRSPSPDPGPIPFPRATSEPPPDVDEEHSLQPSNASDRFKARSRRKLTLTASENPSTMKLAMPEAEEYSWEWGNFPQKTPVWTVFNHKQAPNHDEKGKGKMTPEDTVSPPDYWTYGPDSAAGSQTGYGSGGVPTVDKRDRTRFRVFIEGRTAEFELSIVPDLSTNTRAQSHSGSLGGRDFVEDMEIFQRGKVDFDSFLQDERIVRSDDLVLCWAGDRYITRGDGSPLMEALALWREAALTQAPQVSSRPVSPEPSDRRDRSRTSGDEALSGDEKPNEPTTTPPVKPSSSSWVRWWSRSRRSDTIRPSLRPAISAPSDPDGSDLGGVKKTESIAGAVVRPTAQPIGSTDSAPTVLSTTTFSPASVSTMVAAVDDESEHKAKRYAKTLRLTSEQLKSLNLKSGSNTITFSLSSTGATACTARIFVWEHTDSIVVSDIDGTITKSDALGHVFTMIGRDWTHLGVAKLYTDIYRNGYKIMYLTSRAIGQADSTRDYLRGVKQNDYQLPEGPVIMSPDRLMASLHREVIMRKPEVFKMACLRDIQRLFGPSAKNPFYAGFGNRITDALSYRSVNVPSSRIFTIDSTGEVKMELLELAGYKSSYIHMTDLVDQMFPPINRKCAPEFTDFNFWKTPVADIPLPDLSPPSPALSARSDTSNQSTLARLRNFSLGGRALSTSRSALPRTAQEANERVKEESHLRQMSSFERLSNAILGPTQAPSLSFSPGSLTPTSMESDSEDEGDDLEKGHQRVRRRSISSMPGSLPGTHSDDETDFDDDEEEQYDEDYGYEGENEEEAAEEAFDDDLLATGEMANVPFL